MHSAREAYSCILSGFSTLPYSRQTYTIADLLSARYCAPAESRSRSGPRQKNNQQSSYSSHVGVRSCWSLDWFGEHSLSSSLTMLAGDANYHFLAQCTVGHQSYLPHTSLCTRLVLRNDIHLGNIEGTWAHENFTEDEECTSKIVRKHTRLQSCKQRPTFASPLPLA